jgi:hypothetical protein
LESNPARAAVALGGIAELRSGAKHSAGDAEIVPGYPEKLRSADKQEVPQWVRTEGHITLT